MNIQELIFNNTFYVCRHGKTIWNKEQKIQGQLDSPLLEESKSDLKRIGQFLLNINFDIFFCSPQTRAKNSFKLLGELNAKNVFYESSLRELSHGIYEGKHKDDIDPNWKDKRSKDKWNIPWPEGESYKDVYERLYSFLASLNIKNNTIGIMGHETTNKILIGLMLYINKEYYDGFKQPNTVIYKIAYGNLYLMETSARFIKNVYIKEFK